MTVTAPRLGTVAAGGAVVTLASQGGRILVQLISVAVLARLLTPYDYGLIAVVVAVIGVGEIVRDFGLSSAAIQAPVLERQQRDNLFWANAAIGAVLAVGMFFAAPLITAVFGQPELTGIAQALAVTFLLNGLATQYRAGLSRDLRFRALAIVDLAAPALALMVAVVAALMGAGYEALVLQQIAVAVLTLVGVALFARWIPRLPHRVEGMRHFYRFGWNMFAGQVVGYVANNVDTLLVGYRFGPTDLGGYNRAFQLLMMPLNQIRVPISSVAVPVLSRIHASEDDDRFSDFVAKGQLALGYTLVLGLGLVAGAAEPVVQVFLGDQWLTVVPLLQLFAIAAAFQMLAYVGYWVYVSRGFTAQLFRYSLVSAAIKIVCVVVGSQWGLLGTAIGFAVAPAISWPISIWWLSRLGPLPTARLYGGAARVLTLTVLVGTASWIAAGVALPAVIELVLAVLAAAAVVALALLVPVVRRDLASVAGPIREVLGSRVRLRGRTS